MWKWLTFPQAALQIPALIWSLTSEIDWWYEIRAKTRGRGKAEKTSIRLRDFLLLTGIANSSALTPANIEAWYAVLKFGLCAEIAGSRLHFSKLHARLTEHQKSVFADELGVGGSLLAARAAFNMKYFADFEWLQSGKPLAPVSQWSRFSASLIRSSEVPDFVILDDSGSARLIEAKGTFKPTFRTELKKGKAQIANVRLVGPSVKTGHVAATRIPTSASTSNRPITVLCDPDSRGTEVAVDVDDIKRSFYSKILSFLGFDHEALSVLRSEPTRGEQAERLADWINTLVETAQHVVDIVPLCDLGGGWAFILRRDLAVELKNLLLTHGREERAPTPRFERWPQLNAEAERDLLSLGFGVSNQFI